MGKGKGSEYRGKPSVRVGLMGQRLWEQAQQDLIAAERLLLPGTYYASANFAHQSAEKALKAGCWVLRGEEPPWKHDLVLCLDLLSERTSNIPTNVRAAVEQLQPLFEATRYPSGNAKEPIPANMISQEDAELSLLQTREVVEWVHTLLSY